VAARARQPAGRRAQQPADEQAAADREREPGDDREDDEDDPLRHGGSTVGIDPNGYVLKGTFSFSGEAYARSVSQNAGTTTRGRRLSEIARTGLAIVSGLAGLFPAQAEALNRLVRLDVERQPVY